jgi:membrane protein required for colicin V production
MLDIIFGILMIVAVFKGYQKGLIIALFSIIAFIVGLAAALKLSASVALWLGNHSSINTKWLPALSFAIIFFIVVLLVKFGAKLIEKTFKMALLGWVNRLGGIAFYAVLYIIFFSIFLFYAEKLHVIDASTAQSSIVYPFVQPWGQVVVDGIGKVVPIFKDTFKELSNFFEATADKIPD